MDILTIRVIAGFIVSGIFLFSLGLHLMANKELVFGICNCIFGLVLSLGIILIAQVP